MEARCRAWACHGGEEMVEAAAAAAARRGGALMNARAAVHTTACRSMSACIEDRAAAAGWTARGARADRTRVAVLVGLRAPGAPAIYIRHSERVVSRTLVLCAIRRGRQPNLALRVAVSGRRVLAAGGERAERAKGGGARARAQGRRGRGRRGAAWRNGGFMNDGRAARRTCALSRRRNALAARPSFINPQSSKIR